MQCKSDGNMEDIVTGKVCSPPPVVLETKESPDVKTTESAENFQKFMYELFEKNGVLNDLRAYLRGHIVGLLRSARTGDPPPCQKHFTQRLELPYQALNMLIAEYLLQLRFSYTLSVFVSEIPLANMVLDFAKSLMQGNHSNTALRFKDEDVWSILNYLGVKCDSDHASNIVEMYREETQSPLLFCMLKCMPLYTPVGLDKGSSQESLSSSVRSSDTVGGCSRSHRTASRCKHLVFCKTCQGNMLKIKEKYRKKKKTLAKNMKESSAKPQNVNSLMKNIDVIERSLIDEMFQQLKSVYEAEMQMAKTEEEERVKRSLATHAVQLKRKRIEMEENFKARELELARNIQQKKRFLWGLARLLRDQHQQMARAMHDVQEETNRLSAKEDNLKSQLAQAEAVLRSRGEEMRRQISAELAILEGHLDSMKRERDTINKERSELEHMKHLCDSNEKTTNIESTKEDIHAHYDLLRNEFNILKKYLETAKLEPKTVAERSTLTDDSTKIDGVLNNGQDLDSCRSEDRVKSKQVVNDLKKMKNVNFSQSNLAEIYRERSRSSPSHSTVSSEGGDNTRDVTRRDTRAVTRRLMEENERLRTFARQQREHIDELSSQQARLHAELAAARLPLAPPTLRPRTAPAVMPYNGILQRMSTNANSNVSGHGWRKGAGEEMSFFANVQPRIVVPGDTVPFIGVVRDRHNDNRRYLINQWRSLRRRVSPVGGVGRRPAGASIMRDADRERPNSAGPSVRLPSEEDLNNNVNQGVALDHSFKLSRDQYEQRSNSSEKSVKIHDRNPKFVLRDAKEKFKSKEYLPHSEREPSPSAVIRDAKLRLRKLEIEAEAVEQSYLDFRRKQDAMRGERRAAKTENIETSGKEIDLKHERASFKADESRIESTSRDMPPQTLAFEQIIEDIDEYHAKYDIGVTHFKNKNATPMKVRPIPTSHETRTKPKRNYVETSMAEFRKYYHSEKRVANEDFEDRPRTSLTRSRDYESPPPKSPLTSPRLADEDRNSSPVTRGRKVSSESDNLPRSPLTHNEESNSPKNRNMPIIQGDTDKNHTRFPKIKKGLRTEVFRQTKHDKVKELEILKQNISKIYNLSEKTMADNNENFNEAVQNAQWEMENLRKSLVVDTITEASKDGTGSDPGSKDPVDDKNLLRIEVQSVSQVNDVKITDSQTQDLLLIVESSNIAENSDMDFQQDVLSTQMTILVSPKRSTSGKFEGLKSLNNTNPGEKSVMLSGDDVLSSLYQADANENISSIQMQLENSKDVLVPFLSDIDINEEADYPDDFSADVDNFNGLRYDTEYDHSPISMAKESEDDNFWDS